MAVNDMRTRRNLQQVEQRHGAHKVQRWADEGMRAEIMGIPPYMEDFRERQAERSDEIPYDIERQNKHSEQRSEEAVQRMGPAGETGVPESVRDVISSTGQSLDASIQRAMEDRMGDSLGDVRIHTGPQAANACEEINARAFTVGNHVAFNAGEYDPESAEGQHVLAHELAHVRQQTDGAVSMLPQEDVELEIDPDPALEREAEETAQRVMEGGELGIQRMKKTEVHVQRMPGAEKLQQVRERLADEDQNKPIEERVAHLEQKVAELDTQRGSADAATGNAEIDDRGWGDRVTDKLFRGYGKGMIAQGIAQSSMLAMGLTGPVGAAAAFTAGTVGASVAEGADQAMFGDHGGVPPEVIEQTKQAVVADLEEEYDLKSMASVSDARQQYNGGGN